MKFTFLYIMIAVAQTMGCDKTTAPLSGFLGRLDQIQVYEVDQFATPKNEQVAGNTYLSDYQIKKTIPLNKTTLKSLKKILLDSGAFHKDPVKNCPFIAQYAIHCFNDKNEFYNVILSNESCPKCQIFASDSTFSGNFDLVDVKLQHLIKKN